MAVLNALHLNGPQDYLALERILGMSGLQKLTVKLKNQGLIESLPKQPKQIRQYKLTQEGLGRIEQLVIKTRRVYEPLTYKEFSPTRAGALNAMQIKSRGIGA